jgi:DNA polymerase-3 subunit gamma/tau
VFFEYTGGVEMSYTAFYRKLRPSNFGDYVGQEHIVRTLINQIQTGRVSHAYLFCGTRGTGKTTTARILAAAVNCERTAEGGEQTAAPEGIPCGGCGPCKAAAAGSAINIIEVDGASNRNVDNVRDIREEVKYPPAEGRYKVYIIDEVHMLTNEAFNALLKTLEEPPPHVMFILATTDPQKVPVTIHSRCQRFDFKRVPAGVIADTLAGYMRGEGVEITDEALRYVARLSDGSWRDALSLLDRCAAMYAGEEIDLGKVLDICGSVDNAAFFKLGDALHERDAGQCLRLIGGIAADGRDVTQFANEFMGHLRDLLISAAAPDSDIVDMSAENRLLLAEQAKKMGGAAVMRIITEFSRLTAGMRQSPDARIVLEVACIKLCADETAETAVIRPHAAGKPKKEAVAVETAKAKVIKKAVPEDILRAVKGWSGFLSGVSKTDTVLASFLGAAKAGYVGDNRLSIVCESMGYVQQLKRREDEIKAKLRSAFEAEFEVNITDKALYGQNHKAAYGAEDDYNYADFDAAVEDIKGMINFDIEVE